MIGKARLILLDPAKIEFLQMSLKKIHLSFGKYSQ